MISLIVVVLLFIKVMSMRISIPFLYIKLPKCFMKDRISLCVMNDLNDEKIVESRLIEIEIEKERMLMLLHLLIEM